MNTSSDGVEQELSQQMMLDFWQTNSFQNENKFSPLLIDMVKPQPRSQTVFFSTVRTASLKKNTSKRIVRKRTSTAKRNKQ